MGACIPIPRTMAEDSTGDYANVKAWVEGRLAEALPMDLWEWSHDGKRLCKLVNILAPGTVDMGMLNKRSGPMFHMQNIDFATDGMKKLLPRKYQGRLFRSPDLYEKKSSFPKGIWICLDALRSMDEQGKFTGAVAAKPLPEALAKDIAKTKDKYAAKKKERVAAEDAPTLGEVHAASSGEDSTMDYHDVKKWVEGKIGETVSIDLWEWAHDGRRLCKLANALIPGAVDMSMLNKRSGALFHMQNIDFATDAFKKMLPKKYQGRLFRSPDLYEKGFTFPKGIWICLDALYNLDKRGEIKYQ